MSDASEEQRPVNRLAIASSVMLAAIMQVLDTTIANVALPHMQGSLSASLDQIEWVLTSYIVAAAIMTPPSGWLTGRFGRKRLLLLSILGFTAASVMCGMATSLPQIVIDRVLQGIFGAALVPMSQAVMLDIYPREQQGSAMAIWSAGTTLGPILGPTLGGWLTENYSWRWVFYINIPVGIVAFLGILTFLPESPRNRAARLDWFGFGLLSLAIGAFQLVLDRGEQLDWFGSGEIILESIIAALTFYLFMVHILTAEHPFVKPRLFTDTNYVVGIVFAFVITGIFFSSMALMTPFLQGLQGYPVMDAGILQAPRAISAAFWLLVIGRTMHRFDIRMLIFAGILFTALSLWMMTGFTADVPASRFVVASLVQGLGIGLVFVPLTTLTFSNLAPADRPDGTGLFALVRNIGSSIGIAVLTGQLTRGIQINHAEIVEHVTPTNRLLLAPGVQHFWNPMTAGGAAALDQEVTQQATTIAYIDDFKLLMIVALLSSPLVLLIRKPSMAPVTSHMPAME